MAARTFSMTLRLTLPTSFPVDPLMFLSAFVMTTTYLAPFRSPAAACSMIASSPATGPCRLSTTSNSPLDCGWMPRSNTGDLTETSMRLTVKSRATESLDGSGHTFTAGNSDDVNDLVLLEDVTNLELLLEAAPREVDLVGDGSTVDLDLHDVSLVLTHLQLADP